MASLFIVLLLPAESIASHTPVAGRFGGCPTSGNPAQATNRLKNRAQQVANPIRSTVAGLSALPTTGPRVALLRNEGVVIVGYLLARRQEELESCNCRDPRQADFHIWMVDQPTQTKVSSAVVEMTPRWRHANPGWTLDALRHLITLKSKVRITGWRYLDPNHLDQVGHSRSTCWEIHPITKVEVADNGIWREL